MGVNAHGARSAVAHFGIGALIVVGAALASHWLHHNSIVRDLQFLNLDLFLLGQASPEEIARVAIVDITNEDYHGSFGGRSPLAVPLVGELIRAASQSGARVIGVDLDTSEWRAEDRQTLTRELKELGKDPAPIVWAVGAWESSASVAAPKGTESGRFLKSKSLSGLAFPDCDALPASIPDRFGFIRGYLRAVKVEQDGQAVAKPGMAALISEKMERANHSCVVEDTEATAADLSEIEEKEMLVNFAPTGKSLSRVGAEDLLRVYKSDAWRNYNPLKDRAVLIGASFAEARDKYPSVSGYLNGVDVLAHSVISEKKRIREAPQSTFMIADLTVGGLLLVATWYLRHLWAATLTFILVPGVAIVASFMAFSVSGLFASFIPVLLGVLLHHLLEHLWEHGRLVREVHRLEKKLARTSNVPNE